MTWNHRNNGNWSAATPKIRKGGQWVVIDGGGVTDGNGASHSPRNGDTLQASDFGSSESDLQSAFDSLSDGDTLDIDQDYIGSHWAFPALNHITITSSTDATLAGDSSSNSLFDWNGWDLTSRSASAISQGEMTVSVLDASIFSEGDDIRLFDDNEVHRGIESWESDSTLGVPLNQGQFAVVNSVDTSNDTVTMDRPAHWNYNDPDGTLELQLIDWYADDVIVENLSFVGPSDSPDGVRAYETKNLRFSNCDWELWDNSLSVFQSFHVTVEDCTFSNGGLKGARMTAGTTDIHVHNCESWNMGRYIANMGHHGLMNPSYDMLVTDSIAHDSDSRAFDQHFGGEKLRVVNCEADGCQLFHARGRDAEFKNCRVRGDVGTHIIQTRYHARDMRFYDIDIQATTGDDSVVLFNVDGPYADNWYMEKITFNETNNQGRTAACRPPPSGDYQVDNFEAVDWTIDGELIETEERFRELMDYGNERIGNLTVSTTE